MVNKLAGSLGLPAKEFFYTIDQIAFLLELKVDTIYSSYLYYEGRSVGSRPKDKLKAIDISTSSDLKPDWRVAERELVRWLRFKGMRYHQRGYFS